MRRLIAALLLPVLAAVPAAAQVEGRYQIVSINGQPLPAPSPTEEGVTVTGSRFWFDDDGRYTVSLRANTPEGEDVEEEGGAYTTAGDSLLLSEGEDVPPLVFRWARQGDTLRISDQDGNAYALLREAPAASDSWTPGAWNAVQLNGQALPAPWPPSPDVTVTDLAFAFDAGGGATVRIRGARSGESRDDEDTAPYRVEGDELHILDDLGEVDEKFSWTLRDGTLRLVDIRGHVYTLERAAATAP